MMATSCQILCPCSIIDIIKHGKGELSMKKKLVKFATAAMAASILLSGCGTGKTETKQPAKPKISNASDIIKEYGKQMEKSANFHMDMDMKLDIGIKADGESADIPIILAMSADVLDGRSHSTIDLNVSMMDEHMDKSAEIYMESNENGITTYMYDSDDRGWAGSRNPAIADIMSEFSSLDTDVFKDASIKQDKGTYTVTQDLMGLLEDNALAEDAKDSYSDMLPVDLDDIMDALQDAKIIYTFDKNCLLTSITLDDCEYSGTITSDDTKTKVSASLDMDVEFSNYGKIKESDVKVPSKVLKSAEFSDTDETGFDLDSFDPESTDIEDDVDPEFSFGGGTDDEDPEALIKPDMSNDWFGSYEGTALTFAGNSWAETFGADGWEFANEDDEYTFMTAKNPKYQYADLYVYNYDRSDVSRSDILENGFYGYSIRCSTGSKLPDMSWGGLTFGASDDDILSVYGEPNYVYEGSYNEYEYKISNNVAIRFGVDPYNGLQSVEVAYYGGM